MPKPKPIFDCPFCGGQLQASVTIDCEIDEKTGHVQETHTGGGFRIYCKNGCEQWNKLDSVDHSSWPTPNHVRRYLEGLK